MSDFQFIDIVFFAMIALFLVLRLRSVLGKRTGTERRPTDPFTRPPMGPAPAPAPTRDSGREPDNVVTLPERGGEPSSDPVTAGLQQIRGADQRFNPQQFLTGARAAFEMIIGAFAAGDRQALRPLLSDDVFDNFTREIDTREKAGEKLDNSILRIKSADIAEARLEGGASFITIKFVSEQVNILRDQNGEPLPGQSTAGVEVVDLWTFSRNTRASDPNWALVATSTAH